MKKHLVLVLMAIIWSSLCFASAAQSIVEEPVVSTFERTSSQKGVSISTDVLLFAMPAATLAYEIAIKDWQGIKQAAFTTAATVGATYILKFAVRERRPDGTNNRSFPSAHSSITFANAAFIQRRFGWKWGAPAYAVAAYVGWGRVYSKHHHWYDVVAGAALGAGSAYIFTRPFARKHDLSIAPASDGENFFISASFSF